MTEQFRRESDRVMHDQNTTLLKEIGKIQGVLESFVDIQKDHNKRVEAKLEKMDERQDRFETRMVTMETKATIYGALAASAVTAAVALGKWFLGAKV